jgi:hypothetical protein
LTRQTLAIACPGATVDTLIEDPDGIPRGLALIAHPHPLHGGTRDNKVAHTLAKAALATGHIAVRPNFRGVGATSGQYDHGIGEADDLVCLAEQLAPQFGDLPWTLLGFSFGSYVQHRVAQHIAAERLIMVGPAVSMYDFAPPALRTDIIHGDQDELIPLDAVQAYARDHQIPLHTIAGASHFFHGKLTELKTLVESLLKT